jgi:thiol:disulfide interchange protein DsbC
VEPRSCENPVAAQYRLGQQLGVRGTPALFLEDGRYVPGYMPAQALAAELGLDVGS